MGEYFYTNMCSHLFEVAKRILLLIKIIRLGDYYSHWNFQIPFSHFLCVLEFSYSIQIYLYSLWNYFILTRIIHPACLLKTNSVKAPFSPDPRLNYKCTQPISPWSIVSILKHLLKIHIWKMFLLLFQRIFLCRNLSVFDLSIIIII